MIQFECKHCGMRLRVPQTQAGKKGRCPKCKGAIVVPAIPPADPADDTDFLDVAPKAQVPNETANPCRPSEEAVQDLRDSSEHNVAPEAGAPDAPRPPWPIDAIVYPLNVSGLVHLVGLWLLLFFLCPSIMGTIGLGTEYVPFVYAVPVAYAFYYLAECIRNRAGGGRHPPDYWMHPGDSSKWDCVTQAFEMVGCVAMCFWPVSVYYIVRERVDCTYWLLLAGGVFLFPMVLLSVVLFDSFSGLNPILIGRSILRTFVPYCGTVLLLCGISLLFIALGFRLNSFYPLPRTDFLLRLAQLYLIFVAIALLGDFFRRHENQLDWEV